MIFYSKKRPEEELTEEVLARALSSRASDHELMPHLEPILASCRHETYSPMLYRVQRIGELMGLVGNEVPDPYDAWRAVHLAAQRGEPGHTELERVAFVAHLLLLEENRMRFDSPRLGLGAMETAKAIVDELDPPSGRDHLVDSASLEVAREAGRFTALRALVDARYGNALRYNSRIVEGLQQLAPAALVVRTVEVPAAVQAEVSWLYSVNLTVSRQLFPAARAAQTSIDAYNLVDRHRAAIVMIHLAKISRHSGSPPEESLSILREAIGQLDKYRSPVDTYGCELLVVFYCLKCDEIENADKVLSAIPPSRDRSLELKRHGLRGAIHLAKGEFSAAVEILSHVVRGYISLGQPYDAALVMLYKSESLLHLRELKKAADEIQSAYQLFSALEAYEAERRALRDLIRVAQIATAGQLISRIRELADSLGGCLPTRTPEDTDNVCTNQRPRTQSLHHSERAS